jgi:DNA-binding MurR/RpiR family transcriptional regulator
MLNISEKRIANYFLKDLSYINKKKLIIKNIAEDTSTSPASVVRFCKIIGYSGFTEFKYYLNRSDSSNASTSFNLNETDTIESIISKSKKHAIDMMNETADIVDNKQLEKAIDSILNARHILIVGEGTSGGVSFILGVILQNMGFTVIMNSDPVFDAMTVSNFTSDDLCIGFSNHGNNRDVIDVFSIAKKNKVQTLCITGSPKSFLITKSEIVLLTTLKPVSSVFDFPSISICQMQIISILQAGLMQKDFSNLKEKIKKSRSAVKKKLVGSLEYK